MGSKRNRHREKLARREAGLHVERPEGVTPESAEKRKQIKTWRKRVTKALSNKDPRSRD